MQPEELRSERAATLGALEDLPLIGTLVFVYAINRLINRREAHDLLERIAPEHPPETPAHITTLDLLTMATAVYATIVPVLQKTYWSLRAPRERARPPLLLRWASTFARVLMWVSLCLCVITASLESRHPAAMPFAWVIVTMIVILAIVYEAIFRRERRARAKIA